MRSLDERKRARLDAGRAAEQQRAEALSDLRSLLDTQAGRRVAFRILTECGILTLSYNDNATVTAFREGRRSVGLDLLRDIEEAAPGAYERMRSEVAR